MSFSAELYFGFVPEDIVDKLTEDDWRTRLEGIEQLQLLVSEQNSGTSIKVDGLIKLLTKLLQDENFKISLLTLKIIKRITELPQLEELELQS